MWRAAVAVCALVAAAAGDDFVSAGTRVQRGPDWHYGIQDGLSTGTVIDVRPWRGSPEGGGGLIALKVRWDNSEHVNVYRYNTTGDRPRDVVVVQRVAIDAAAVAVFEQESLRISHAAAAAHALAEAAKPSDVAALRRLHAATGGDAWATRDGWDTDTNPCIGQWHGVRCSRGDIIALDLLNNGLTGALPGADIAALASLQSLRLAYNGLTGPLPPALCKLRNLRFLSLEANALSGPLPPCLADLPRLEALSLHSNDFSGPIPVVLARAAARRAQAARQRVEVAGVLAAGDGETSGGGAVAPPSADDGGEGARGSATAGVVASGGLKMLHLHGNPRLTATPEELDDLRRVPSITLPVGIDRPALFQHIHNRER